MPAANKVACVEIGGIPISLETSNQAFYNLLVQRYEGFLSTSPAEFTLQFDIVEDGVDSDEDVRVFRDGSQWKIERGDFCALWDPHTGIGSVRQNANPYSLDSVLRILHSLILAERGGFLLHAASTIRDGRAYLFSGVSGAGKTTMTRLAPSDVILLTDEVSYVLPVATQAAGGVPNAASYQAFGTPFAGELAKAGDNTKGPIAGLFFLEQGPGNRLDTLSPAEAVRRLMRNILFFAEDRKLVEEILASACDFVGRVPIRRLTFYPDARVWDEVGHFAGNSQDAHVGRNSANEGVPAHA